MLVPEKMLLRVSVGQFLGMTLWFSASAAAPALAAELGITDPAIAWLTMAVQAGFVVGTLASAALNLPDVLNARRLFALGCAAGAAANAAIAFAATPAAVMALRFATGAALACVYPTGMKIVSGWFLERRGTALGYMVGALTVGTAFPYLLAWSAADVPWRVVIWISSTLAVAGGALVAATVADGPHVSASAPFDAAAIANVLGNRGIRLATLGYLGHMWELYAMWAWMPAFTAASLVAAGQEAGHHGSLLAFITIASGAIGCAVAGRWADARGKARIAGAAMLTSAACAAGAGLAFARPFPVLVILAVVWGFSVVADSAQFSALVAEHSARTHVGTALTIQTCVGFLLTMVSLRLLPAVADRIGWQWAFVILVPGPALGAVAMRRMERDGRGAEGARGAGGAKGAGAGGAVRC
jgi:MFS family permease